MSLASLQMVPLHLIFHNLASQSSDDSFLSVFQLRGICDEVLLPNTLTEGAGTPVDEVSAALIWLLSKRKQGNIKSR
jgi:hypothetical protein